MGAGTEVENVSKMKKPRVYGQLPRRLRFCVAPRRPHVISGLMPSSSPQWKFINH